MALCGRELMRRLTRLLTIATFRLFLVTRILLCAATLAFAGTLTTYTGSDDDASITGPWRSATATDFAD